MDDYRHDITRAAQIGRLPRERDLPEQSHGPIARIAITTRPAEIEELWRAAEAELISSPYQTFGWYSAWLTTAGARKHCEAVIVTAFDALNHLIAILPLVKRRLWNGCVICEFAGGRHSNANFGLFAPMLSGLLNDEMMRRILCETARLVGRIDVFCFINMPLYWCEHESWLSNIGVQPSPSFLHAATVDRTFDEWRSTWLSPSRRKKLRQKFVGLNRIGPVRLIEVSDQAEIDRVLAAFYQSFRKPRVASCRYRSCWQRPWPSRRSFWIWRYRSKRRMRRAASRSWTTTAMFRSVRWPWRNADFFYRHWKMAVRPSSDQCALRITS